MAANDNEMDMLMELTTHPGWRVVRREVEKEITGLQNKLLSRAEEEFDLVRKEADTNAIRVLKGFFDRIETKTLRYRESM